MVLTMIRNGACALVWPQRVRLLPERCSTMTEPIGARHGRFFQATLPMFVMRVFTPALSATAWLACCFTLRSQSGSIWPVSEPATFWRLPPLQEEWQSLNIGCHRIRSRRRYTVIRRKTNLVWFLSDE